MSQIKTQHVGANNPAVIYASYYAGSKTALNIGLLSQSMAETLDMRFVTGRWNIKYKSQTT